MTTSGIPLSYPLVTRSSSTIAGRWTRPIARATTSRSRRTPSTSIVSQQAINLLIVITSLALGIIAYAFMMVNEKTMSIKKDLDRTKLLRHKANQGSMGGNKTIDRAVENIEQGRALY